MSKYDFYKFCTNLLHTSNFKKKLWVTFVKVSLRIKLQVDNKDECIKKIEHFVNFYIKYQRLILKWFPCLSILKIYSVTMLNLWN